MFILCVKDGIFQFPYHNYRNEPLPFLYNLYFVNLSSFLFCSQHNNFYYKKHHFYYY
nr:MAG TPA: hypothetical protein [Caudoviricetes sp.]